MEVFGKRRRAGFYPSFSFSDVVVLMPGIDRADVVDSIRTMAHNGLLERDSLILWRVVNKPKRAKEQGK